MTVEMRDAHVLAPTAPALSEHHDLVLGQGILMTVS